MKKMYKFLLALALIFGAFSQVNAAAEMPTLSTEGNTTWYHVIFQRYNANLAMQDNGADAILTTETLVLNQDNQLWKIEAGAVVNQYVLTSKAGRKVYWDAATSRFKAGTTATEIKLVASASTTYTNSWELQRDGTTTAAMNPAGGSDVGKQIGEYNMGDGGNPVKFVSVKTALQNKITEANNKLTNTAEGADPGKFTATSRTTLQNAINAAQAVYNNSASTDAEFVSNLNTLNTAITTYNNEVIAPLLSTEGNVKWYFIQGTRPANTYLTTRGAGLKVGSLAVIPNDTQLWKLVAIGSGFGLVNKSTGEYINTNVASGTEFVTQVDASTNAMRAIPSSEYTNKTIRFWIENLSGQTPAVRFHAGGSGNSSNVMNYTGNANDNCTWLFMDYNVALKVFLQTAITDAQTALTYYPEGTDFGQNSATDRTTLNNAISAAQSVYNDGSATETAIKDATTAMNAATAVYKTAAKNVQKLLSTNTANYRWYRLKNRNYTTNDIITTNGVAENGGIITQNSGTANDNELWRFEPNTGGTGVKIINKATGLAIKENGTSTQATLVAKALASELAFTFVDGYWGITTIDPGNGYKYLHRDGSSKLVGWELSAAASQWALLFVEETAKPVARTITVSSADTNKGTAAILGSTESTVSTAENVTVKPIPVPGFIFSKWTNAVTDADVSTEPVFTYTVTTDIQLKANFVTLGTVGRPLTTDDITPVYYYIQSASDGSHVFSSYSGDFRNNVMIAPAVAGKIIHNKLSAATTTDHALWQIVNVSGVVMLKNKATGWFMTGSHSVGTTGSAYTATVLEAAPTQYVMKTADATSYTNAWKNNLCDRLSLVTTANSMLAWYFIVEPGSMSNYSFTTGNVNTPANAQHIIRTTNKVITVEGVENFDIYSISGQKLNKMQALESGIYVVRIQNQSFKVNVK